MNYYQYIKLKLSGGQMDFAYLIQNIQEICRKTSDQFKEI